MKTLKLVKKTVSLLLVISIIISLVGCTSSSTPTNTEPSTSADTEKGNDEIRVGIIYTMTGRGDMAFNDATYEGAERAAKEYGIKVDHTEPKSLSEIEMALESMSASGDYDLIVGISFEVLDAITRVAPNYPDQKYALIDVSTDMDNVVSYIAKENESAFLVGALAGLLNQYKPENGMVGDDNVIGIVGAVDVDVINRHIAGYTCGAKYVNPDVEVLSDYVGGFGDTATAQTIAERMNKMGADIVYNVAAGGGLGIFKAAADNNFIAIGLDSNQNPIDADHIVASSLKRVDEFVYSAISDVVNDEFKGGQTFMLGLAENGVGYTVEGSNIKIDPEVVKIIDDIKEKIISGEIKVPTTKEEISSFVENNKYSK